MKEDRTAFNKALSGMIFETACRRAIRHLYDSGYKAGDIEKRLSYPVSLSVIEAEIEAYESEKRKEEEGQELYDYRMETDAYGRATYIRVKRSF